LPFDPFQEFVSLVPVSEISDTDFVVRLLVRKVGRNFREFGAEIKFGLYRLGPVEPEVDLHTVTRYGRMCEVVLTQPLLHPVELAVAYDDKAGIAV
jgi:hypothetical protein